MPDIKENSMAKKQEVSDEQQLKRELHETQKSCKYLQTELKKAEAKPPQKDPVILRKLEDAERRIAELERNLEVKRKQIEGYKEQLEPKDDLELRYQGAVAILVSRDGEASVQGNPGDLRQFVTMMSVMAEFLADFTERAEESDSSELLERLLADFAEHPKWRAALLNVGGAIEDDDEWGNFRDDVDPADDEA